MAGKPPTISTNNTSFNVGDTLSVTITFGASLMGTLYIGNNSISIPQQRTTSYTYDYVLTTSGNYSVYFRDDSYLLDSNTINITVVGSSSSSSVFLTTVTKVKTALENVFVKKSDIKDNLTSIDTDKPLSANQGKVLNDNKEDKSNKSSSITTDTGSTTKYPTVKAVENYAQPKGNYLTSHQDLTNYIQKNNTNGLIKNDGTIDTSIYLDIDDLGNILDDMIESEPLEIIVKYIYTQQTISNFILKNFVTGEYGYTDENNIYHDFTNEAEINYSNNTLSFKLPKELSLEEVTLNVGTMPVWSEDWYFYNLIDEDNDKTITISYYSILKEPPSEE